MMVPRNFSECLQALAVEHRNLGDPCLIWENVLRLIAMNTLLHEMTREEIRDLAPQAVAVLPTAAIEQHGPHLPIITDTLICGTVAEQASQAASEQGHRTVVAPVFCYGSSHHHRPFPGVLSLRSSTYMDAVTEVLEGLVLAGFSKLVVLNGHGGNADPNGVVSLDFPNRLGHDVMIACANYWDVARSGLVEQGLIKGERIPGHAGQFETALVSALRPDLAKLAALNTKRSAEPEKSALFTPLAGAVVQRHGTWFRQGGFTDDPTQGTSELGRGMLKLIIRTVAEFLIAFQQE